MSVFGLLNKISSYFHDSAPAGGPNASTFPRLLRQLLPWFVGYGTCIAFMTKQGDFCDAAAADSLAKLGSAAPKVRPAPVPDLRFGFSAGELLAVLSLYGEEGRARYNRAEIVDFVYMGCYTVVFAGLAGFAARWAHGDPSRVAAPGAARWLVLSNALPAIAMFFDVLENAGIGLVLHSVDFKGDKVVTESEVPTWVNAAGWFGGFAGKLKWSTVYLLVGSTVANIAWRLINGGKGATGKIN